MSESIKKGVFILSLCMAAIVFFLLTNESNNEQTDSSQIYTALDNTQTDISAATDENKEAEIAVVDIKGEINKPGVYEVNIDSRVNDVIQLAGGFTDDADESRINLAQKVHDEMIIIVTKMGEGFPDGVNSLEIDSTGKVRVNYASQKDLEALNGVGPSRAEAIIQYREENGLFQSPEDLLEISGIGEKTLESFIEQIQIP